MNESIYMPVLRWKRAERDALRCLSPEDRSRLTPLIEMVPNNLRPTKRQGALGLEEMMSRMAAQLDKSCGESPFYVDADNLLECHTCLNSVARSVEWLVNHCLRRSLRPIPVIAPRFTESDQRDTVQTANAAGHGICLRFPMDTNSGQRVFDSLSSFVTKHRLAPESVDIVLDYRLMSETQRYSLEAVQSLAGLARWRTVTIVGGSFPKDLSELEKNRQHQLRRVEWNAWEELDSSVRVHGLRLRFGDFTIQHPYYHEPPQNANFSASIRYTATDHWVIMRGEGVRHAGSPGCRQWPANAQLLCRRPEFCGADFSFGDQYIAGKASQSETTGNATTWLCAGINHHMTLTVRQLNGSSSLSVAA